MSRVSIDDFYQPCGCRSAGECTHNWFVEDQAWDALIDMFAEAMKQKWRKKKMQGYDGWEKDESLAGLHDSLRAHTEKGDMIDVANLAAMIWNLEGDEQPPGEG